MYSKKEKKIDLENGYELVLKGDYNDFNDYTQSTFIMRSGSVKRINGKLESIDVVLFVREKGSRWVPEK